LSMEYGISKLSFNIFTEIKFHVKELSPNTPPKKLQIYIETTRVNKDKILRRRGQKTKGKLVLRSPDPKGKNTEKLKFQIYMGCPRCRVSPKKRQDTLTLK
jgi:hypothetical protein